MIFLKTLSKTFKIFSVICLIIAIVIFLGVFIANFSIQDEYKVIKNSELTINSLVPLQVHKCEDVSVDGKLYNKVGSRYEVELKIFGIIPVRKTSIEIVDDMYVTVLGTPFGMKIYTEGVLIIDISDVDAKDGYIKPAQLAGLKIGDFILSIDNQKVFTNEDVAELIEKSNGKEMEFLIKRDNVTKKLKLKPVLSKSTNIYKAGIWVRDSSAGIGTLTFYCSQNNILCGLGHSVNDNDTGKILSVGSGEMVAADIVSYTKAQKGAPGELHGRLHSQKLANFILNCEAGVYGNCVNPITGGEQMPIALKQEIQNGEAYIISTVDGSAPKKYKCSVSIIKSNSATQNILVEITDNNLLSFTGGIIQGMSGSPIIQNGRLIGAVTHVLVDDPTKGYAIFAENMLETAQSVAENNKLKDAS